MGYNPLNLLTNNSLPSVNAGILHNPRVKYLTLPHRPHLKANTRGLRFAQRHQPLKLITLPAAVGYAKVVFSPQTLNKNGFRSEPVDMFKLN